MSCCKEPILRTVFDSATLQTLEAGGTINMPEITTASKCDANASGGVITLRSPGTYEVHVNVTTSATAAGTEEVQLYVNGSPKAGAHALATTAAAGDLSSMSFTALVTVECCGTVSLTVRSVPATSVRVANVTLEAING